MHTYDDMASDLRAYMDHENTANASILGHSMGGKTALQFAHEHPEHRSAWSSRTWQHALYTRITNPIFRCATHRSYRPATSAKNESHSLSQLQDPEWSLFLMKNLRREKSGGFTGDRTLPVLAASLMLLWAASN